MTQAETMGSRARREFVSQLPCMACGRRGCANAHVLPKLVSGGGIGRKGHYTTIAPLCVAPVTVVIGGRRQTFAGCHQLFDEHRNIFDRLHPEFDPDIASAWTERAWQAFVASGGAMEATL